jgi:hypothetical protein
MTVSVIVPVLKEVLRFRSDTRYRRESLLSRVTNPSMGSACRRLRNGIVGRVWKKEECVWPEPLAAVALLLWVP